MEALFEALRMGNVLLHAPAGAGKTYLIANLVRRWNKDDLCCTAMTGAAAANIADKGICAYTLHAWAGIQLGKGTADELATLASKNFRARLRWIRTRFLIIDEISMMGAELFDKLDYVAKKIRRSSQPFGGIRLLLSGDFLQLRPVKDNWVFNSTAWKLADIRPVILKGKRRFTDVRFAELLDYARRGALRPEDVALLQSRMIPVPDTPVKPTILFSHREDVNKLNNDEMQKLPGPEKVFKALDVYWTRGQDKVHIPAPDMSTAKKESYARSMDSQFPKELRLRVGAQVMLRVNVDVSAGLVNGSRGVVTSLEPLKVLFANGNELFMDPFIRTVEDETGGLDRSQIPLVLAWALTIHCSQGSTLDCAVLSIGEKVFAPGQAYVALSRIRSLDGLYLEEFAPTHVTADPEALAYVDLMEAGPEPKVEPAEASAENAESI